MGKKFSLALGVGLVGAAVAGYALVVRPWLLHWGMRADEAQLALPGDELVQHARYKSTRAITIDAPATRVWQWLVQIGVGRGGFYTYDALENMANLNIHSAKEIRPEWQMLQVGDSIQISPVTPLKVESVEPNHALVLHIVMSPFTAEVVNREDPTTRTFMDWTWAFVLDEIAPQTTRLIVRVRADYQPAALWLLVPTLLEPIHFVMESGMLQGIKRRAESPSTEVLALDRQAPMQPKIAEKKKKAGVCYAVTDTGLELPVIDVTHPAFEIQLNENELQALLQQYLQEIKGPEKIPAFLRPLLFGLMRQRSVIMRGLMGASGTFNSGMNTYLMKLGPDNLNAGYFSAIDRRIAASPAGTYMRLRLQDMAQLLAGALMAPLEARRKTPLHLFNIGAGPATDSLNALILVRQERPDVLAGRPVYIHTLDLDTAGADFGARALASLLAEGAPLHDLQISFDHTLYNWSDPAQLRNLVGSLADEQSMMAASSEGALFEYGSDQDITGNLQALSELTPADTVVAGSVTRADALGLKLNGAGTGIRAALQFRGLDAFAALALRSGWKLTKVIDRPLSHDVLLQKT